QAPCFAVGLPLWTPCRKGVLETQEVEEIQFAGLIAVGLRVGGREQVLEAEKVEEVQLAAGVAVGVAGGIAAVDDVRGTESGTGGQDDVADAITIDIACSGHTAAVV